MRGRPDIDIRLPPVVHPGDEVVIEIKTTSYGETPIDFFDVIFEGDELHGFIPVDTTQISSVKSIANETIRVCDEGTLEVGERQFIARFEMPKDAPASYLGLRVTIRYQVRLHISIPWWPDLREAYEILVEPHPVARPSAEPATARSNSEMGAPFVELSVADTSFAVGDEVSGAFAAGNLPHDASEGVELSLVAFETSHVGVYNVSGEQYRHNLPNVFKVPRGGREAPFRFRVPKEAVPSFETPWSNLKWFLQAVLRVSLSSPVRCEIPVTIGRYAGRHTSGLLPEIGAARWRAAWSEAGEPYGFVLHESKLALVGSRGDVAVEVELYETHTEVAFAATFEFPSILIGLRVEPQLLVMLPSPIEAKYGGYKIKSREKAQAEAFLDGPVHETITRTQLISANDTTIQVRSPAPDFDKPSVDGFLRVVSAIADALATAIEEVPPPADMRDALAAWRAFATAMGGTLTTGGMVLRDAHVDGATFHLATKLGPAGEGLGTTIEMEIDPPLSLHRRRLDVKAPDSFEGMPPGSHDVAKTLASKVEKLGIRSRRLTIEIGEITMDPVKLRPMMVEMLVLAQRLRGDRSPGPYR